MDFRFLVTIAIWTLASSFTQAYDPSPLQDFCVAVPDSSAAVFINGKVCKDPKLVTAADFFTSGLNIPGNTTNREGKAVNIADLNRIPGLNTLGINIVRADFAPNGVSSPHIHPRATEIVVVVEGTIYAGFVTTPSSSVKGRLFDKTLKAGDVFVFPIGHVHFLLNVGKTNAVVFLALNSQNPGVVRTASDIFGPEPSIPTEVLTRSYQLDKKVVDYLQSRQW